ncbi:hypothetical protein D9758_010112 [Tetrapyrgos nigripes]|uniref:Uncharacterized protein n=1 Tax=Tetrapyrgos nigripes TaxID=182062 RepID=A0A8H5FSA8_9AGAR|nr:hypothetical protein D9758_010112 [Tetrapyrgos nigripes]
MNDSTWQCLYVLKTGTAVPCRPILRGISNIYLYTHPLGSFVLTCFPSSLFSPHFLKFTMTIRTRMIIIVALYLAPLVASLSIDGFPATVTPGEVVTITWFRDPGDDPENWHFEFMQNQEVIGEVLDPASHAAPSAEMTLTIPPEATGQVELLAFTNRVEYITSFLRSFHVFIWICSPTFFYTQPVVLPTSPVHGVSPSETTSPPDSQPSNPSQASHSSPTSPPLTSPPRTTAPSTSSTSTPSSDSDSDADANTADEDLPRPNKTAIIAGSVVGAILLLLVIVLLALLYRRWRRRAGRRAYSAPEYEYDVPPVFRPENMVRTTPGLPVNSYESSNLNTSSDLKDSHFASWTTMSALSGRIHSPPPYTPSDSNPPTTFDSTEYTASSLTGTTRHSRSTGRISTDRGGFTGSSGYH